MITVKTEDLNVAFRSQEEVDAVLDAMAALHNVRPALRLSLKTIAAEVGAHDQTLPSVMLQEQVWDDSGAPVGDFFVREDCLHVFQPLDGALRLWTFSMRAASTENAWANIVEALRHQIDGRRLKAKLVVGKASRPMAIAEERNLLSSGLSTVQPQYDHGDVVISESIAALELRTALLKVAQNGKVRLNDFASSTSTQLIDLARSLGLIQSQFLLTCKKDSRQITDVDDKESILSGDAGKLRCATCQRSFKEESLQEIISLSNAGRTITAGSKWMVILVTEMLINAGIPADWISWNAVSSSDEIDIVIDVYGSKVFFELKDREFGLGDAYPFVFRCTRYGAQNGVVIAIPSISPEATTFLKEPRQGLNLHLIQDLDELKARLPKLIESISLRIVGRLFERSLNASALSMSSVLTAWYESEKKRLALLTLAADEAPAASMAVVALGAARG